MDGALDVEVKIDFAGSFYESTDLPFDCNPTRNRHRFAICVTFCSSAGRRSTPPVTTPIFH